MNRAVIRSLAFMGLFIALGCTSDNPTDPTGTTATATPTATPTPTPTPTPPPAAATGCTLEPQPECGGSETSPGSGIFGCCDTNVGTDDVYGHQVVAAMEEVLKDPGVLDGDGRIRDENAFVQAVAAKVEEMFEMCAQQGGPPDELAVKATNDFSEQFDIVLGSNNTPLFGFFAARCVPARF